MSLKKGQFVNGSTCEMTELLTSAQMRAIEAAAIASGQTTGAALMERAGETLVEAVLEAWPALREGAGAGVCAPQAWVLCGPGNNGGDGFVIARLLSGLGWQVAVYFYGAVDRLPPDARLNHDRWAALGAVLPLTQMATGPAPQTAPDLVIDALFGTGLTRRLPADCEAALARLQTGPLNPCPRIVAVDVPSGLCADSGRDLGAQQTHLTVSFHRAKLGLYLDHGLTCNAAVVVADIGLTAAPAQDTVQLVTGVTPALLAKDQRSHKFGHGHALVLAGGPGRGGAGRLAARAALRVGAGLVTLGCPPAALAENAARLDAVMLRPMASARDLARSLQDPRVTALCVGPGFGLGAAQAETLAEALKARRALVLDADAITLLARDQALQGLLHAACVLTPHEGEFARLFPDLSPGKNCPRQNGPDKNLLSKPDATRAAAARCGAVVLLKGPDTVVSDPQGRTALHAAAHARAAPWLATAGSGDVLAGLICGLLARGLAPFDAACTAAWLHAACARQFGPGLIAEDLPEALPKLLQSLGL